MTPILIRKKINRKHKEVDENLLEQEDLDALIRKAASSWYTSFTVKQMSIEENFGQNRTTVNYTIAQSRKDQKPISITGEGAGVVDAMFRSCLAYFGEKYKSLNSIRFTNFSIIADLDGKKKSASDADVTVELVLSNELDRVFRFRNKGKSMIAVTVKIICQAIEFFINAEIAVLRVKKAHKDAINRHRADLVETYMRQLSELVQIADYYSSLKKETK